MFWVLCSMSHVLYDSKRTSAARTVLDRELQTMQPLVWFQLSCGRFDPSVAWKRIAGQLSTTHAGVRWAKAIVSSTCHRNSLAETVPLNGQCTIILRCMLDNHGLRFELPQLDGENPNALQACYAS
jgi:hypothetical protein